MNLKKIFRGYPRRVTLTDGTIGGYLVTVETFPADGHGTYGEIALEPRLDIVNHSPDGFMWGYGGSGPSQLAFAILAEMRVLGALQLYHSFVSSTIARLPRDCEWELTSEQVLSAISTLSK